jgi:hypothetical protein
MYLQILSLHIHWNWKNVALPSLLKCLSVMVPELPVLPSHHSQYHLLLPISSSLSSFCQHHVTQTLDRLVLPDLEIFLQACPFHSVAEKMHLAYA